MGPVVKKAFICTLMVAAVSARWTCEVTSASTCGIFQTNSLGQSCHDEQIRLNTARAAGHTTALFYIPENSNCDLSPSSSLIPSSSWIEVECPGLQAPKGTRAEVECEWMEEASLEKGVVAKDPNRKNHAMAKESVVWPSPISCGSTACVARKTDGSVEAWGKSGFGGDSTLNNDVPPTDVVDTKCYGGACMAIMADRTAVVWGVASFADTSNIDLTNVADIVCGSAVDPGRSACVVRRLDGTAEAWGDARYGGDSNDPSATDLTNVVDVHCSVHVCVARKGDGTAVAWGEASRGGDTSGVDLTNVADIKCTAYACVARKVDGTVVAWGNAGSGGAVPTDPVLTHVVDIACGTTACTALDEFGSVRAWGHASNGGRTEDMPGHWAGSTTELTNVVAIQCGGYVCVARKADGTAEAWGTPSNGGDTSGVDLTNVAHIECGIYGSHGGACVALKTDGTAEAWGLADNGGDASGVDLTSVVDITCGGHMCVALKADGSAEAWGGYGAHYECSGEATCYDRDLTQIGYPPVMDDATDDDGVQCEECVLDPYNQPLTTMWEEGQDEACGTTTSKRAGLPRIAAGYGKPSLKLG